MATHLSFDSHRLDTERNKQRNDNTAHPRSSSPALERRKFSFGIPLQSVDPGKRRIMTREQGCALEMIGHAVDYLHDTYINEGPDDEILDFSGPMLEAAQILIAAQRQLLSSLPLAESFTRRLRNALSRRKSPVKSSTVIPLSSSR